MHCLPNATSNTRTTGGTGRNKAKSLLLNLEEEKCKKPLLPEERISNTLHKRRLKREFENSQVSSVINVRDQLWLLQSVSHWMGLALHCVSVKETVSVH